MIHVTIVEKFPICNFQLKKKLRKAAEATYAEVPEIAA